MDIAKFITGLLAGAAGGMGIGGGGILLLYLSAFSKIPQLTAQGINLVFFLPIAAAAIFIHIKNGFIKWKTAVVSVLAGIPGVFLGAFVAKNMEETLLRGIFAVFLLIIGMRELFGKAKTEE